MLSSSASPASSLSFPIPWRARPQREDRFNFDLESFPLARANDRYVDTRGNAARDEKTDRFRESSSFYSEMTPEGKRVTKLDQILLNGNNIALLVPGGMPDEEE